DKHGMMITSSAMLYPKTPVDLSDREHFRVHANTTADKLFISKPVLGRASGQWSVQYTRRFNDAQGNFAGVIVISLDPALLSRAYSSLNLGKGSGLALVGNDGIVRAGSGLYAGALGTSYSKEATIHSDRTSDDASVSVLVDKSGQDKVVAV